TLFCAAHETVALGTRWLDLCTNFCLVPLASPPRRDTRQFRTTSTWRVLPEIGVLGEVLDVGTYQFLVFSGDPSHRMQVVVGRGGLRVSHQEPLTRGKENLPKYGWPIWPIPRCSEFCN